MGKEEDTFVPECVRLHCASEKLATDGKNGIAARINQSIQCDGSSDVYVNNWRCCGFGFVVRGWMSDGFVVSDVENLVSI